MRTALRCSRCLPISADASARDGPPSNLAAQACITSSQEPFPLQRWNLVHPITRWSRGTPYGHQLLVVQSLGALLGLFLRYWWHDGYTAVTILAVEGLSRRVHLRKSSATTYEKEIRRSVESLERERCPQGLRKQ